MHEPRTLTPHIIGRQPQLQALAEHLAAARQGAGRLVLISGDAGGGKTRLLREFQAQAAAPSLEGYCYDEEPAVPYGPWLQILGRLVRAAGAAAVREQAGPWLADLSRLLPELAGPETSTSLDPDPQMQKRRLFEAIYHLIQPAPGEAVRIVALEDIHWADPTSQELLRYLARAIEHDPILVVCTYRSDELHRRHPLNTLIAYLTRERLYHEVRLAPLSRPETATLLEALLARPLPDDLIDRLYERTEGNPFFLEEIVKALRDQDQLEPLLAAPAADLSSLDMPMTVKASILGRTRTLDDLTLDVLRDAAVVGRRFTFDTLLGVTGASEAELLRVLEVAIQQHLVDEEGDDDAYRFRHELIREALYDDLLGRERRIKHRAVLQVLEAQAAQSPDSLVSQLAYHSLQARDLARAASYARQAGDVAFQMYAYREAVAQYETALEWADSADLRWRADLCYKLAEAATPLGDSRMTRRRWLEAKDLYAQLGATRQVADTLRRLGRVAWDLGEVEAAFAQAQEAIAMLEQEPPGQELVMAYSGLSQLHMLSNHAEETIFWGEKALALALQLGVEELTAHPLNNIGVALIERGDPERGIASLERSMLLAKQAGLTADVVRAYHNLSGQLLNLGEVERSSRLMKEGLEYMRQTGWAADSALLVKLAWVELELGRWDEADALIDRALARRPSLPTASLIYGGIHRAEILRRQGHLDAAREQLEAITRLPDASAGHVAASAWTVLAQVYHASGMLDQAVEAMDRAVEIWRERGSTCDDVLKMGGSMRAYMDTGQSERLAELVAVLRAVSADPSSPLDRAKRDDLEGSLALYERRWAAAARHFAAAAAAWQQVEFPYQEAISRRGWVEARLGLGDPPYAAEVQRELDRARQLFARLGAAGELAATEALLAPPPARSLRVSQGIELTPREREVMALLARGLSNRAIAEALVISPKTAEIHVSNILGKLSLSSRAQVAAYALEHGLVSLSKPTPSA
jgi:DNA-binding CsgD family transcriptional regulator/tetratricopeptide (TPR) repeat protein